MPTQSRQSSGGFGYSAILVLDPGREELAAALQQFVSSLGPTSASFLFFAGHGMQIGGANHLLLRDTRVDSADEIVSTSAPLSELLSTISGRRPVQSIVVLDACRDAPLGERTQVPTSTISSAFPPSRFYMAYSAGSGQTALDSLSPTDTDPNGVFTRSFLKNLDRTSNFDTIIKKTRSQIANLAASVEHEQVPAVYDQSGAEFTVLGPRDVPPEVVVTARPTAPTRALIIGASLYREELELPTHLPGVETDVELMRKVFAESGISSKVLLNRPLPEIFHALQELAESEAETVLVYYAGHGTIDGGDGVLLWHNWEDRQDLFLARGVRVEELTSLFSRHEKTALLFLDTSFATDRKLPEGTAGFLADKNDPSPGMGILAAAEFGRPSADTATGKAHSPYALALQNAFARSGQTLEQLATQVRADVWAMTRPSVPWEKNTSWPSSAILHHASWPGRPPAAYLHLTGIITAKSADEMAQKPTLWAGKTMRDHVLTRPLDAARARLQCRAAGQFCG